MSIVAKWLDRSRWLFGMEVGLGPGHTVSGWGPSSPFPTGAQRPQFSAHACCDETAGWIKMPLGREVGLGRGHIMLDGDQPTPPPMGHTPPIFVPCLLWPNGRSSELLLSSCQG